MTTISILSANTSVNFEPKNRIRRQTETEHERHVLNVHFAALQQQPNRCFFYLIVYAVCVIHTKRFCWKMFSTGCAGSMDDQLNEILSFTPRYIWRHRNIIHLNNTKSHKVRSHQQKLTRNSYSSPSVFVLFCFVLLSFFVYYFPLILSITFAFFRKLLGFVFVHLVDYFSLFFG